MKISEYNQMMRYLTSTGEFSRNKGVSKKDAMKKILKEKKPVVREEDISERIARMHHIYDNGPRPKHMDNPNIKSTEDMKKIIKPIKKPVKTITPVKIDFDGINTSLNTLEQLDNTAPIKPTERKKKSEGLAYLLGVDE
jgi:hypothetical protein